MGVNRVFLLGNLGADPEIRYTPSQQAVCNLRLATGERRKNPDGQWVDHTEWHRVVTWGKTAENCAQYLAKGKQVFVEGKIQTKKWQDQEGKDRYTTEIVAFSVQFIGSRGENAGLTSNLEVEPMDESSSMPSNMPSSDASGAKPQQMAQVSLNDDDIPF